MPIRRPRSAVMATSLFQRMILGILLLVPSLRANSQSAPGRGDESWAASSQATSDIISPTRTTETYTKVGNRTIHKARIEVLGPGGSYQPYSETETEKVQENAKNSRTTVRSYSPGPNGEMRLIQVTEEEKQQLPSGDMSIVRTTSNPDEYENLKVIEREVGQIRKAGMGSEETESTTYRVDERGTLVAMTKVLEEKKAAADGTVQTTRTTTAPDVGGTWQLTESVQETVKSDGQNQTTDSITSRPNFEGQMTEVSRISSKKSQTDGQVHETTQRYSADVPGVSPDGHLDLVERTMTSRIKKPGRTVREQQVEHVDPADGKMKVMMTTSTTEALGHTGTQSATTTSVRGLDGSFSIVSSETRHTNPIPIQVEMSPADRESANPQK